MDSAPRDRKDAEVVAKHPIMVLVIATITIIVIVFIVIWIAGKFGVCAHHTALVIIIWILAMWGLKGLTHLIKTSANDQIERYNSTSA